MTSSASWNEPTPQAPSTFREWSPPLSLLEVASGDEALIAELIGAFHTDTDDRIHEMLAALAVTEFSRIRLEAHSIKGGARQLGADALADACQELETLSTVQEMAPVAAGLSRVQELYDEIRRAMAAYSGSRSLNPSVTSLK